MKHYRDKMLQALAKKWPILAICATIIGLSYYTLISHYFRLSRVVAEVGKQDALYTIESTIFDWKINLRGPVTQPTQVGILAIDEKTLKQFGSWPFSRRYYEQAFRNLKSLGVKWIGYDVIFADDEVAGLPDIESALEAMAASADPKTVQASLELIQAAQATSPGDRSFRAGMEAFQNIVMGYFYFATKKEADLNLGQGQRFQGMEQIANSAIQGIDMPKGRRLEDYLITKAHGLVGNTDYLNHATTHFAFFNNDADDDAINRWITLVANIDGQLMPSLGLKTVAEYLNREIFVFFNDNGIESLALINRDDESDSIEIPVDANGKGRALINHRGYGRAFYHFSLGDAYANTFTAKERAALKDGILLLGGTATGTNDIRPNPFDPSVDGVENHAAFIDNVLTGRFYKRPAAIFTIERSIILVVGILFTMLLISGSALLSGSSVVVFLVGYYYFDKIVWFDKGIWAYMFLPCAQISLMFTTVTLYQYITEEREKKKVKGAFQHYLSPEVIDQVLDHPDQLRLGGEKKELTVFFSDVRGFTTISESLTPEKLCELMNEYFTPMTGIVLRSKGVLDKYIGDAIMAFWGAPLQLENSAVTACQASIDMLYALDKLREDFKSKGFPDIDIGIGLNTGPMSVGNMGSGERFTYTVMGDAVNLGSRLEGLTKEYGIKIMMSEFTHRKLPQGLFFTRDLDDIRVKGKNEPVKVFHLMRPDFLPSHDQIQTFITHFEEGRRHYTKQNWQESLAAFSRCLDMKPDDKASAMYIERIEHYKDEAPGQSWDGVYTFKHK
jgi:adenylate cyclase